MSYFSPLWSLNGSIYSPLSILQFLLRTRSIRLFFLDALFNSDSFDIPLSPNCYFKFRIGESVSSALKSPAIQILAILYSCDI